MDATKYITRTLARIDKITQQISFLETQMEEMGESADPSKRTALYRELANFKHTLQINKQMLVVLTPADNQVVH